jgi:hypothetical protein
MTPEKPWRPKWKYRQSDQWPELKLWSGRFRGPSYSMKVLRRKGVLRFLQLYGFDVRPHDRRPQLMLVAIPDGMNDDRVRRFANYVDRMPKLFVLTRVSSAIRSYLGMPDRLRAKRFHAHYKRAR